MGNQKAPEGQIFVCGACKKTSTWKYGFDDQGNRAVSSPGWDESCMMNSVLCYEKAPGDKIYTAVTDRPGEFARLEK